MAIANARVVQTGRFKVAGDSHGRYSIPYMIAGHLGGFETGRAISAGGEPTGALHASILNYFSIDTEEHGDPAAGPISGL